MVRSIGGSGDLGSRGGLSCPHEEPYGVEVYGEQLSLPVVVVAVFCWDGWTRPFSWPAVEGTVLVPLGEHPLHTLQTPVGELVHGTPDPGRPKVGWQRGCLLE